MSVSANERFEIVGELYYRDTGYLRPGKSVPLALGYDANDDGNRERFDRWFATRAFTAAIERIAMLERVADSAAEERSNG